MNLSTIFLAIAFLAGIAIVVAWPLFGSTTESPASPQHATLEDEHAAVLRAVRDLDFDLQVGKLSAEDHARQREALVERGVALLKQIDEQKADAESGDPIEAAIRAARRQ
ncbi:MAG TPA: hypothetical protein VMT34_04830 [Aggregatilineales bacterium]|nr:hypothetical protein [Aggregatilineales bacterium]